MLHSQLHTLLLQAGLSEAEVLVYLELLKQPAATIWELKLRTGLTKNAVYRIFAKLQTLKMVEKTADNLRALSLKNFVTDLANSERRLGKLVSKIKQVAPFLRTPTEAIKEFETFQEAEEVAESYLFMSGLDYDVNLDFGDFEGIISKIGGVALGMKFRNNRMKRAASRGICTTNGPYTNYFTTKEAETKYDCKVNFFQYPNFKNRFVIFSDRSNYVLFLQNEDDFIHSTLVNSRVIADVQRLNFQNFSQQLGKM